MRAAYLDTSAVAAVLLGERGGRSMQRRIRSFALLVASPLLEAELRSLAHRHEVAPEALRPTLDSIHWVMPDRPLTSELRTILQHGYLRGADVWHLACALFVSPQPRELSFLSLDEPQAEVAAALGFRT